MRAALFALVLVLTVARVAAADEPASQLSLVIASGALLPTPWSRLGVGPSVGVDASWRPGFAHGWLELGVGVDASQRTASGHGAEGDLAFEWRTVARELWLAPELRLRVPLARTLGLSVGGGPALVLVETLGGGAILGDPFADGHESSAVLGERALVDLEWRRGSGALVAEGCYDHARVSHRATGANAHLDAFGVRLGYRVWF